LQAFLVAAFGSVVGASAAKAAAQVATIMAAQSRLVRMVSTRFLMVFLRRL
jgi:hypothetical protein